MKKKTYLVILALCAAMAMTACGTSAGQKEETKSTAESQDTADEKDSKAADSAESDSDKESTGTVSGDTRLVSVDDVSKYVTIGQYKGLSLDKSVEAVTDDMVDGRIKEELQNKAEEVTEGSVQNGDVVTINYVGTKDGVAFDGGTATDAQLTLGSGQFIDGFEDGVVGHNIGDTFDINVTFPTDYRISTMQNRSVVFHTTLKKIRLMDYQPIDDEFAKDFSEYTTLNEWENEIFSHLQARRKTSVQEKLTREVMAKIIADSDIPIDDDMKEEITQIYYDDFLDELEMNQIPLELYCKRSGHTEDEIYADKEQEAIKTIQAQSVLHAVAAAEKISITQEELNTELQNIAQEEEEDPEEFMATLEEEDVENIADQLTMDKTMAFILDSVVWDD